MSQFRFKSKTIDLKQEEKDVTVIYGYDQMFEGYYLSVLDSDENPIIEYSQYSVFESEAVFDGEVMANLLQTLKLPVCAHHHLEELKLRSSPPQFIDSNTVLTWPESINLNKRWVTLVD